jgi:hypothetical protein
MNITQTYLAYFKKKQEEKDKKKNIANILYNNIKKYGRRTN